MMAFTVGALVIILLKLNQISSAAALGLDDLNIPDGIQQDLKDGNKVETFIRSQIPLIRSIMANGDLKNSIPPLDPYNQDERLPKNFKVDLSFGKADVNIDKTIVTGMSNFELKDLRVNTKDESILFAFEIPKIFITGYYKLNGTFQLDGPVEMYGSGPFSGTLIRPTANVNLSVNYENNTGLSVSGSSVSIDYEDVNFKLEGFMPGHPLKNVVLWRIRRRARDFFEESKDEMEERLGEFMLTTLNSIFDLIFTDDTENAGGERKEDHTIAKRDASCGFGNMNSYIDQVIDNARPLIKKEADPIILPDKKFVVSLYGGRLTGLSSIRRTGNVVLSCTPSDINLDVDFGFKGVRAGYRWKKRVTFVKLRGKAEIKVRSLYVTATISQPREPDSRLVINNVQVRAKGISVSGLTFVGNAIVGLLSNIFRKAISNAMEKPIRKILQKELDKIPSLL